MVLPLVLMLIHSPTQSAQAQGTTRWYRGIPLGISLAAISMVMGHLQLRVMALEWVFLPGRTGMIPMVVLIPLLLHDPF